MSQTPSRAGRIVVNVMLPILLLAAAGSVAAVLLNSPPTVPKSEQLQVAAVVGITTLEPLSTPIHVEAYGTVVAARQVRIQPEVGGRVIDLHPRMVRGGLIRAGDLLFRIDPADYEIALKLARADLEVAKHQIDRLKAAVQALRSQVVQQEAELEYLRWNSSRLLRLSERDNAAEMEARDARTRVLSQEAAISALRARVTEQEKAVASAEAEAIAARARVDAAELALARTQVQAPFDAIVLTESVEVGQLVSPQTNVATLAATDEFWAEAAVPVGRLNDIRFRADAANDNQSLHAQSHGAENPGNENRGTENRGAENRGAETTGEDGNVTITLSTGLEPVVRRGHVLRLLGELDPQGRMARVLVGIRDPLGLRGGGNAPGVGNASGGGNTPGGHSRLLLGSYVRLDIEAGTLRDVFSIPRRALRENDRVWIRNADGQLEIRPVEIVWRRDDDVLVSSGVAASEQLVTTHLASVVPGMPLDVRIEEPISAQAPQPQDSTEATP